jgi:hypothetical protein
VVPVGSSTAFKVAANRGPNVLVLPLGFSEKAWELDANSTTAVAILEENLIEVTLDTQYV